jgi:serine/threonine-protein kinase
VLIQSAYALALLRKWIVVPQDNEGLLDRTRALVDRAIRTEPQLGEAQLARGYLALHTADPVTAVIAFRDAIARSPSLGLAHASLACLLLEANRIEDGKARLHAARRLSPGFLELGVEVARSLALCGEWEMACAEFASHKSLRLPSSTVNWIRVLAYRGDRAGIAQAREELAAHGPEPLGIVTAGLALADVYLGERSARSVYSGGDETVSEGVSSRRRSYVCQLGAELAGFGGDAAQAIRFIEIAERCGLFDLLWMERCPLLDTVRGDPQFPALLDRVARRAEAMADAMWTR